jgi:phosphoglycolate phosphatase-like HAD superfamily hydrolase
VPALPLPAARQLGIATATVITGGFSEQELREAGAAAVFDSLLELRRHLDEPPFV